MPFPGTAEHPRTLGWVASTALAMGGSNQSLFLITALFAGQGDISGQGSAAVPLLIIGLLLAWAAAPGWTELVLMYPKRVGGIAATCAEAFRPYNPVLANLTGVCYWWGWVPTCGLTAIFSGAAIHEWYLPNVPVTVIYGDRDSVVPSELSARVADRLPQLAERLVLPGVDHNDTAMFGSSVVDAVVRLADRVR